MHRRVLIPHDLCSPGMCRRRVRRVNLPRSAREGDHQSPSPPLPMTTSAKGARPTRQPSESGAGPRRTPPEIIISFDWMHLYTYMERPPPRRCDDACAHDHAEQYPLLVAVVLSPRTVYCCNCLVISIS